MARFCAQCGTEVDDTAVFCPTCGQPIAEAEAEMPAAPAWPDPTDDDHVDAPTDQSGSRAGGKRPSAGVDAGATDPGVEEPTRVEERPTATDRSAEPPGTPAPRSASRRSAASRMNVPVTMPVTLSGWLIGGGAVLATLGILVILIGGGINVIDLLLLVGLAGIAATVFASSKLPAIPHVRLATLIVVLVGFGVALDRVAARGGGAGELLLFLGLAAAAIGAVILELGHDQPLGGAPS